MMQTQLVKKTAIIDSGDFNLSSARYLEKVEINSEFEIKRLGEIIDIVKDKPENFDGSKKYYSTGNVSNDHIGDKFQLVEFNNKPSRANIRPKKGDVGFAKMKNTNKVVIVDDSLKDSIFSTGFCFIRSRESVNPNYLYHLIKNKRFQENKNELTSDGIMGAIRQNDILNIEIPLPPLEIQEQIVKEIVGYQKIIDGCRQVVENYKPVIDIDPSWEIVQLKNICTFAYGKPLKKTDRIKGEFPVYGSNGIVDKHNNFLVESPFIVIGRKGSAGRLNFSNKNGFPIDTTFYISSDQIIDDQVDIKFLFYSLKNLDLDKVSNDQTVPGLNRNDAYRKKISLPSKKIQINIVEKLEHERKVIESNKELIKIYENKKNARINKVWSDN